MKPIYEFRRIFLLAGVLVCAAATSFAQSETPSGPGAPGQAVPATVTSPYAGSVPTNLVPGVLQVSLEDAINRGLKQNLGALLSKADIRSARGRRWKELSDLLPHVTAAPYVAASEINLSELGITSISGATISPSVGPFSYFDARLAVTQALFDWKSINSTHAASQNLKSAQYTFKDARELVVLAVGYVYLQAIADEARIETGEAQVKTAQALFDQSTDQVNAGTSPDIDALRTKVELQTRQQQLIQARNNFAIQKLIVARVIGLAPGQEFELSDKSPYRPFEGITVDEALKRAYASRSDYQAAMIDVRAAEFSRKSAIADTSQPCPLTRTMVREVRIPLPQRKCLTHAGLCRFRSFRGEAFRVMFCRLMRDWNRAAIAWTICGHRLIPTSAPRCLIFSLRRIR